MTARLAFSSRSGKKWRLICKLLIGTFLYLLSLLFEFVRFASYISSSQYFFSPALSTSLFLSFSFLSSKKIPSGKYHKINFSGIQITNEVVDVEAALKIPSGRLRHLVDDVEK